MFDDRFFDSIGFKTSGFDELRPYLDMAFEKGVRPISPNGYYAYWPLGNGCEVWVTLDKQRNVISYAPHFVGSSRVNMKLTHLFDIEEHLAGALQGELIPETEDGVRFPFVFYVPSWDFVKTDLDLQSAKATGPLNFTVQLAAFATEIKCYDTEQEALDAQTIKYKWAPQFFIPVGLFRPETEMPSLQVSLGGTVLSGRTLTNPITNQRTIYMRVQTLDMIVDVVSDPMLIKGRPKIGGIISGSFWLSGRPATDIKRMHEFRNHYLTSNNIK